MPTIEERFAAWADEWAQVAVQHEKDAEAHRVMAENARRKEAECRAGASSPRADEGS